MGCACAWVLNVCVCVWLGVGFPSIEGSGLEVDVPSQEGWFNQATGGWL